jgi:hypothetical protein
MKKKSEVKLSVVASEDPMNPEVNPKHLRFNTDGEYTFSIAYSCK